MATIPLLECNAREHDQTAVSLWFSGCSSLYRISIMGVLSRYYHLFNQNFTSQRDTNTSVQSMLMPTSQSPSPPPYLVTGPTLLTHNTCKWTLKQVLRSDPFSGKHWWLHNELKLCVEGLSQFILSMARFLFFILAQPIWLPALVKTRQRQPVPVSSIGALPNGFSIRGFQNCLDSSVNQHDPFRLPTAFWVPLSGR